MTSRSLTLFTLFALVGAAVLAGCAGEPAGTATPDSNTGPTPDLSQLAQGQLDIDGDGKPDIDAANLKPTKPLTLSVTSTGPRWVPPGTSIAVSAAASGAKGAVTYVWAIGALPDTVAVEAATLDTKTIASGGSKSLKFTAAGIYEAHCHPHPYMLHNVTVIEGYKGPSEVTVAIVDGATTAEAAFVPRDIVIAPGTTVKYVNKGAQAHTTTVAKQNPALKLLDLKAASGEVVVEGNGWQHLVVAAIDSEGKVGIATLPVYVKELPAAFTKTISVSYKTGRQGHSELEPAQANLEDSFNVAYDGYMFINWSVADAASTAGAGTVPPQANTAKISLHLVQNGETQDTMTGGPSATGAIEGGVLGKAYKLIIVPEEGVQVEGTITVTVVFEEPTPPEPVKVGGGDGHGDHAGH